MCRGERGRARGASWEQSRGWRHVGETNPAISMDKIRPDLNSALEHRVRSMLGRTDSKETAPGIRDISRGMIIRPCDNKAANRFSTGKFESGTTDCPSSVARFSPERDARPAAGQDFHRWVCNGVWVQCVVRRYFWELFLQIFSNLFSNCLAPLYRFLEKWTFRHIDLTERTDSSTIRCGHSQEPTKIRRNSPNRADVSIRYADDPHNNISEVSVHLDSLGKPRTYSFIVILNSTWSPSDTCTVDEVWVTWMFGGIPLKNRSQHYNYSSPSFLSLVHWKN